MTNVSNSTVALNWIDGAWVGAKQVRESINPATYKVIGAYADGGLEVTRVGIAAAKRAFQTSI
jgi:betaine-aldehyde dehydrogenase